MDDENREASLSTSVHEEEEFQESCIIESMIMMFMLLKKIMIIKVMMVMMKIIIAILSGRNQKTKTGGITIVGGSTLERSYLNR